MKRISVVWICLLLLFSSAFVLMDVREKVEGKAFVSELMASGSVHNIDTDEYFNEIQTAITDPDTLDGHTIEVSSGTYPENVIVNKDLTILGEDKNTTIINGGGRSFWFTADGITLSGFSLFNASEGVYIESSYNYVYGNNISNGLLPVTLLTTASNNIISYNKMYNNRQYVVCLDWSSYNTITNNEMYNNGGNIGDGTYYPCIDLYHAHHNNISFNRIYTEVTSVVSSWYSTWNTYYGNILYHTNDTYGFDGISLVRDSHNNTISMCKIYNTPSYGIYIDYETSHNNKVTKNEFRNCEYSILAVGSDYIDISNNTIIDSRISAIQVTYFGYLPEHIKIYNNTVYGSKYGLYLALIKDCFISSNNINNCEFGIYIYGSLLDTEITNNTIFNSSSWAIYVGSNSEGNVIHHNNFISASPATSVLAFDNGTNNQWDNGYPDGGNYWSDYNGIDIFSGPGQNISGSDGIGDTPYIGIQDSGGITGPIEIINETVYGPSVGGEKGPIYLDHGDIINCTLYLYDGVSWSKLYEMLDYDLFYNTGEIWLEFYLPPSGMEPGWYYYAYYNYTGVVQLSQDNYPLMIPINYNPKTYNISLSEGWNLISLPLIQNYESIHQVLDSITGKWDYIQVYDALDTDHWKTNATFKPDQLNDLKTLNHKIGFWINITEPNVNLTVHGYESEMASILLYAGWNLVGYPTLNDTMTVANALWGTGADRVEVCDPSEPYRIKEVGPSYVMKPGEGYWVHVPVDTIWIVDW